MKMKRIEHVTKQEKEIQGIEALKRQLKRRLDKWKIKNLNQPKELELPLARHGVTPMY